MRIKRRQLISLIRESFDKYTYESNDYIEKMLKIDFYVSEARVIDVLLMIQNMKRQVRSLGAHHVMTSRELQEEYNKQFDRVLFKEPLITNKNLEAAYTVLIGQHFGITKEDRELLGNKAFELMRKIGIPYPEDKNNKGLSVVDEYAEILRGYLR